MSFTDLLKRASSLLGFSPNNDLPPRPIDGEIIYCKNNVCVHPPAILSQQTEHYPGYLNIRSQDDQVSYLFKNNQCYLVFCSNENCLNI